MMLRSLSGARCVFNIFHSCEPMVNIWRNEGHAYSSENGGKFDRDDVSDIVDEHGGTTEVIDVTVAGEHDDVLCQVSRDRVPRNLVGAHCDELFLFRVLEDSYIDARVSEMMTSIAGTRHERSGGQ